MIQGKNKSPRKYLERLFEAYKVYNPFDPEAREHESAAKIAFVNQADPDIHWKNKLQHLGNLVGKQLTVLVALAEKVFNNRENLRINRPVDGQKSYSVP